MLNQGRVDRDKIIDVKKEETEVRMSKDDNKGFQINHYHHMLTSN